MPGAAAAEDSIMAADGSEGTDGILLGRGRSNAAAADFSEDTSFALWICGERIEWDAEKKKLAFTFMNRLDILEIRNMTILADRGVLEIAVNEDTACYYVPGNGELVKSIELSGEMEAELFLIR